MELDKLFFDIEGGNLSDAKTTFNEIMTAKIADTFDKMKVVIAKGLCNERSYEDEDEDEDVKRADKELKKRKIKLPNVDVDVDKDISDLAAKRKKKVKEGLDEAHEFAVYNQTKDHKIKFVKSFPTMEDAKEHAKSLNGRGIGNHRASDRKSAEEMSSFVKEDLDENDIIDAKEFVPSGLDEAKGSAEGVYHDTYRGALQHAYGVAKAKGYELHDEDYHTDTSHVDPKPARGKSKSLHFPLTKNGVLQKKQMHVQVYNRDTDKSTYELNHYIS